MEIFGWLLFILLALFGIAILVIFTIPFIVTEVTMMKEKINRAISDKKFDLDKRSEARQNRDTIKRQKEFELADRKLEAKLQKIDKQLQLHEKKIELAKQYKEQALAEKEEINAKSRIVAKSRKHAVKEEPLPEVDESKFQTADEAEYFSTQDSEEEHKE